MKFLSPVAIVSILIYASSAFAMVEPAALCGIESVAPAGFSDPMRNPALLPFNQGSSAGAAGTWSPFQKFTMKVRPDGKSASSFGQDGDDKTSALYDGTAGLLLRFTNSAIGIAAGSCGDGLYAKHASDSVLAGTIYMYDPMNPSPQYQTLEMKTHETSSEISPAFGFAWGYRTSESFSWGLSIQGGTSKITVDSFTSDQGTSSASGAFTNSLKEKTVTTRYTGRIKLGFLYRDENVEAGFILATSDLVADRISYSYAFDPSSTDLSGAAVVSGKKTASNSLSMAGPPSLTIGLRYMTPYIDWVGEGHVCVGGSRNVKSVDFSYDLAAPQTATAEENTAIEAYGKGGIILHPSAAVKLCAGIGFGVEGTKHYSQSTNGNDETLLRTIMASAGADVTLGHVTIGAAALYGNALAKGRIWENSLGMTSRLSGSLMRVTGGVSLNF